MTRHFRTQIKENQQYLRVITKNLEKGNSIIKMKVIH